MALSTFRCNHLMPLRFKGLSFSYVKNYWRQFQFQLTDTSVISFNYSYRTITGSYRVEGGHGAGVVTNEEAECIALSLGFVLVSTFDLLPRTHCVHPVQKSHIQKTETFHCMALKTHIIRSTHVCVHPHIRQLLSIGLCISTNLFSESFHQ